METRVRRGLWPSYPEEPPTDAALRQRLLDLLARDTRMKVSLPAERRESWLRLAVESKTATPLLTEFYKAKATQAEALALYELLTTRIGDKGRWLAQKVYDELGLLPEPIFVLEKTPAAKPAQLQYGPENTIAFVGALDGDQCAIALLAKVPSPLWIRPCAGLEPRRLPHGELFLLGVEAKLDGAHPVHWLPILVDDDGSVALPAGLRAHLDDRLLASFIVSAPRFVLDAGRFRPFPPALTLASAALASDPPTAVPSFVTELGGARHPTLLGFAATAKARPAAACPSIDRERCAPVRGAAPEDRCELSPPQCIALPHGASVRIVRSHIVRPEPCLREYGERSVCHATDIIGAFVDAKASGGEFVTSPHVTLFQKDH
jgi:hypothetical protein